MDIQRVSDLLQEIAILEHQIASWRGEDLPPDAGYSAHVILDTLGYPPDVVHRTVSGPQGSQAHLIYLDLAIADELILEGVLTPLLQAKTPQDWTPQQFLLGAVVQAKTLDAVIRGILQGQIAVGCSLWPSWVTVDVAHPPERSISEPKNQEVVHGPHNGFIENLWINLIQIRQAIRSPFLRFEALQIGELQSTTVVIASLAGVTPQALVRLIRQRLHRIRLAGFVDSSAIASAMGSHAWVPTVQYTERPDDVVAALLEGRVAVLVDRTPAVLLAPSVLMHFLTRSSDYYQLASTASFVRIIRLVGVMIGMAFPGLYVALATVNQSLIPLPILFTFIHSRLSIPFPVLLETLIMLLTFDVVYEAGLQMPGALGQTISIVGAVVVGQAAIMAGIVSAPTVIVVAISFLSQFLIPEVDWASAIRLVRYPLVVMSGIFGLIGMTLSIVALLAAGTTLTSFGMPYLAPLGPLRSWAWRDGILRRPPKLRKHA